ncbi:MAG: hypothetical protein ACREXY_09135 [Gammaproteobacteria bacterium]
MTTWANTETGELVEADCPNCAETREWAEEQVRSLELERRKDRGRITRLEREVERAVVAKRDGAEWVRITAHWQAAFPQLKPRGLSVKSARATKVFQRLETGCSVDDVLAAIDGAKAWPYVVFGKRQRTGSKSDLAIDLEDIVSVGKDRNFDFLVVEGNARDL